MFKEIKEETETISKESFKNDQEHEQTNLWNKEI